MLHYDGGGAVGGAERLAPDMPECLRCMRAAAALDDMSALYWLATTALGELGEEQGAADVAVGQGVRGAGGAVVGMSVDECLEALTRAADLGHPAANYHLALMLRDGGNLEAMRARLQRAVDLGDAEACFCLGDMMFHGTDSFQVSHKDAFAYFMSAARQRHPEALCCVGAMYYHGMHVPRDLHRSFRAYQLAAEEGSAHAMRNLAAMHVAGEGCERSEATARYMLKIAKEAEAAHPE